MSDQDEVMRELLEEIRKLGEWKHCMSYNDSYFGEPAGLVKRVAYQMERLADKIANDGGLPG